MKVKILRPAKSAMQSGKANTKKWILQPQEETNSHFINPLTGWTSVKNTLSQLTMEFISKEEAINYAQKQGFEFEVVEPKSSTLKKKSYAANFTKPII